MTLIPRTISHSVRAAIPEDNYTSESLLQKLKQNPRLLLKFFMQATQSQGWCARNGPLMHRMFNQIYRLVMSDVLPFDHAINTCASLIKYNLRAYETLYYDPSRKIFAGIPLLYAVPSTFDVLKQVESDKMTNIAPFVNVGEFAAVYKTFNLGDFTHFHYIPALSVQACLVQCRVWNYTRGLVEIQKVFIQRVLGIFDTFRMYFFAYQNDLPLLKCYCEEKALSYKWNWYLIEATKVYYSLNLVIPASYKTPAISYTDIARLSQSVENNKCVTGCCNERIELVLLNEKTAAISLRDMDTNQLFQFKNTVTDSQREAINYFKIEYLTFERNLPLVDEFILGLCNLCKNVYEIHVTGGYNIADFIAKLGKVAPQVKSFGIYEIERVDINVLLTLSLAFRNLQSLSLLNILQIDSLNHLNLSNLLCLSLEGCGEISNSTFLNIQELKLVNIEWKKLKYFISGCYRVEIILINSVDGFKLSEYPYPQKIIELTIDAKTLAESLDGAHLSTINEFINLKNITVLGTPSVPLKEALERLPLHMALKVDTDYKE